jgi:hypothetical protein
LYATPSILSLEKDIAEVGPVNLRMAHRAGLVLRRLIVDWSAWSLSGECVALQTEHVHQANLEQARIGGTVGRMTTAAAFGFHGHMLVNEGPLLVDVALVADGITAREVLDLPQCSRSMRIMAVVALHQTLIDPVMIRFGKIRFGLGMASVTQLWLILDEKVLFFLGMMGGMAIEAADVAAGVGGFRKTRLLMTIAMATKTASTGLLP